MHLLLDERGRKQVEVVAHARLLEQLRRLVEHRVPGSGALRGLVALHTRRAPRLVPVGGLRAQLADEALRRLLET